jgi:Cu-Zn family superoxide dismutase
MTTTRTTLRAVAVTAALAGTALAAGGTTAATPSVARAPARHAHAELFDTAGDQVGTAHFVEDGTGRVHVNVKVAGLSPGLHGIHVHAIAKCTVTPPPAPNLFNAAGGHHNPDGGFHGAHAGDLPNLIVNGAGRGRLNDTTIRLTLSPGPISVFDNSGSALIVHADPDDYVTDPTGTSGERIACGVITSS